MARYDMPTLIGGILLLCTGIAFAVFSLRMSLGTAQQMGPGYFPLLAAIVLCLLSIGTILLALRGAASVAAPAWRPLFWVLGSTIVFTLTLRTLGLVPAVVLTIVTSSFADRQSRFTHSLLLGIAISICAWLIFVVLLGLPLTTFRLPL